MELTSAPPSATRDPSPRRRAEMSQASPIGPAPAMRTSSVGSSRMAAGTYRESPRRYRRCAQAVDPLRPPFIFPPAAAPTVSSRSGVTEAMKATDIRRGHVILIDGQPCRVMEFTHRTPGNLRAFVQVRLRNLVSGNTFDTRLSATDFLEEARLETKEFQVLYRDAAGIHVMDTNNYEQYTLSEESVGDQADWLQPEMHVQVEWLDGKPIGIGDLEDRAVDLPVRVRRRFQRLEILSRGDPVGSRRVGQGDLPHLALVEGPELARVELAAGHQRLSALPEHEQEAAAALLPDDP